MAEKLTVLFLTYKIGKERLSAWVYPEKEKSFLDYMINAKIINRKLYEFSLDASIYGQAPELTAEDVAGLQNMVGHAEEGLLAY